MEYRHKFLNQRLSAGWVHTLLASDEGVFYGFGTGKNGELGHSVGFTEFTAAVINLNLPPIKKPENVQVAVGAKHTLVLADGCVYSTGSSDDGRLGHNLVHGQIKFPNVDKIRFITCGSDASLAISQDGMTVYAWGLGYTNSASPEPIVVKLADPHSGISNTSPITMLACGTEHALALCQDGLVWSWGSGRNGRLGHGTLKSSLCLPLTQPTTHHRLILHLLRDLHRVLWIIVFVTIPCCLLYLILFFSDFVP